jgi:hypothetical protein
MTNSKVAEVAAVGRGEKNDFQISTKRGEAERKKEIKWGDDYTVRMMEELKLAHQNEIGSIRAELSEVKSVIKSGFSNLASLSGSTLGPLQQPSVYDSVSANQYQPSFTHITQPPSNISTNPSSTNATVQSANIQPPPIVQQPQSAPYIAPHLRNQPQPLLAQLPSLQSQPPSYTSQPPSFSSFQNNNNRRFSGCQACVAQNNRWCDHCLLCGGADHRVNACPRRNNRQPAPSLVATPNPTAAAPGNG